MGGQISKSGALVTPMKAGTAAHNVVCLLCCERATPYPPLHDLMIHNIRSFVLLINKSWREAF